MLIAYFNRFTIEMEVEQAKSVSHAGDCENDAGALVGLPEIAAQLDAIPPQDIAAELKEYGAWDDGELRDEYANRLRIVWIAGCDIEEQKSC